MTMLKTQSFLLTLAFLLIGCGKSDDDIRRVVQEELAKSSTRTFITKRKSPACTAGL